MKTFSTSGTGNQQTLSEIESDKVPVYDSVADAEADLANLEEGQIVATKDTGSELSAPVDTVQSGNMHAVTSNAVAEYTKAVRILEVTGTTNAEGVLIINLPATSNQIFIGAIFTNQNDKIAEFSRYGDNYYVICKNYDGTDLSNTYVELKIAYI